MFVTDRAYSTSMMLPKLRSLEPRRFAVNSFFLSKIVNTVIHCPQLLRLLNLYASTRPLVSHKPFLHFAIYHHRLILAPWIVYGIPPTHTTLVSIFLILASVPSEIRFEEFCNARDSSVVRVCLRSTDVNILHLVESYLRLLTRWSQKGLRLQMVRVAMRMNLFVRSVGTMKPEQQSYNLRVVEVSTFRKFNVQRLCTEHVTFTFSESVRIERLFVEFTLPNVRKCKS